MAEIRPFRGLRFDEKVAGALADLVTPPYDVIDAAAQQRYYQRSPHNIIRLELGQQYPGDSPGDNRYTRAAAYLADWLHLGVLRPEPEPAIYVYRQSYEHRGRRLRRTGCLALLRLEEWEKGIVLPHEATMAGPKADRLQLMRATEANCSPVFGLYEDDQGFASQALRTAVAGAPAAAFAAEDGEHELWAVTDATTIAGLRSALSAGPLFIADGHHRYETALYYRNERRLAQGSWTGDEPWNFVLALLVAVEDPGLLALPTHRLVNPRLSRERLREILGPHFALEPMDTADVSRLWRDLSEKRHAFGIYGLRTGELDVLVSRDVEALRRLMPEQRATAWRELDVSVLHELVLRRALGLAEDDWSDESRVAYTRDEAYARRAVDEARYQLAIFLDATPVRQVLAVARAGEVMPPKSTYFHPKPVTGLVMAGLASGH